MKKTIVFRDDDAGADTVKDRFKKFKQVHALFVKYGVLHTVSLICKDVEKNKPFVKFLKAQAENGTAEVQIHCWEHYDFTENQTLLMKDLPKCKEIIQRLFGITPTILYPPWNKADGFVWGTAAKFGLTVSTKKMSLSGYLRGHEESVINLHSWHDECIDLEPALIKYTSE